MSHSRRHILFVEEHPEISSACTAMFADLHDYALHVVTESRGALGVTGRQDVDLAVVDLSGTEVKTRLAMIRSWRRDGLAFPVITTSAQDYAGLSIEAFDAGGDDFLRKPYMLSELYARIQRHLARRADDARKIVRIDGVVLPEAPFLFAGATIWPDLRITFPNGSVVRLSAKQVGILREFALRAGTLVLKEHLVGAVWGVDANTNSASVHQYLYVLRKLFRDGGVDLHAYVTPENKVGWRIADAAVIPPDGAMAR